MYMYVCMNFSLCTCKHTQKILNIIQKWIVINCEKFKFVKLHTYLLPNTKHMYVHTNKQTNKYTPTNTIVYLLIME